MAESGGALRCGRRQLQERVFGYLKISQRGLALFVFDGKCFAKTDRLRLEAHGRIVILRVNSDMIEPQAGVWNLLRSMELHQEYSNTNARCKQSETADQAARNAYIL